MQYVLDLTVCSLELNLKLKYCMLCEMELYKLINWKDFYQTFPYIMSKKSKIYLF